VKDIVQRMADAFINDALGFLPSWARDVLTWIVGELSDIIKSILSLPDDLVEWFSQLLRVSIDPIDLLLQVAANIFSDKITLFKVANPIDLMPEEVGPPHLPAVTQNLSDVTFDIRNDRCIIGASL
jgi:hypothetical protein